ncbi:DNA mismatch repair endonuclease MutL [Pseudoflavonifractor sp. MSJ-37]|uniref:DNA mismatch repair endonuclease MutL n=1 Tax=Pseudoflavonifractor sp. MSJ-37 TaxID=2841531 RepID=UPI001C0F4A21|nr:DNA mismatch repair endonuclease MutL [Pseudoflavonifractor sp. MSJ-37]MBU5435234.1 DNA mismatch repair endonuclease MutL [Pseudoflavonifractor sp. MSJ-37]
MPHIQTLDAHVADLIAAGEVVERPASVVKELVENAIDAGASSVTVEIQHGGMTLIRVTDDGCGIAADEAETAFLRHATSKIRSEYDLEAIGTLGFRGEALAAISAVSRVDLLTRTAEETTGVSLELAGGVPISREEAGCPQGTTMVVRDLFYNTPARLKFMKKDSAEGAAVFAAVQRQALSHPEVSVRFLRDGKQELLTPGDGQLKSAVYAVLGRDMALGLLPVKGSGEEMSVSGFASLPTCCRGTRGYQHFFVNGRYVKSRTMMAALEEAYANQKMVGKFPGCVLHLTTRLNAVDVNVHPTKQEVKFGSERKVFDAVYYAVKSALEGDRTRPAAVLEKPRPHDSVTPDQTRSQTMTAEQYRTMGAQSAASAAPKKQPVRPGLSALDRIRSAPERMDRLPLHDYTAPRMTPAPAAPERPSKARSGPGPEHGEAHPPELLRTPSARPTPEETAVPAVREPAPAQESPKAAETPAGRPPVPAPSPQAPAEPEPSVPDWRIAGELFDTYIVVEQEDRVLLIDKHAAHERMNFDRLKATGYTPMRQVLLAPVVFTPPAEEGAVLLQSLDVLDRFGFEAEDFGGGALIVRQCPDYLDTGDIESTLSELAGRLLTTGRADPEAARDELMHTMACKAAIKGGQKNDQNELLRVAEAVMRGQVKYCPHGRPVAIELTRGQLEKQFKRA